MPPTKTWKKRELKVARSVGSERQRLSGSSGRTDETRSDSKHSLLFIESKYRKSHAAYELWKKTRDLAKKEDKVPVLALSQFREPGFLWCVHQKDMRRFVIEWLVSQEDKVYREIALGLIARKAAQTPAS